MPLQSFGICGVNNSDPPELFFSSLVLRSTSFYRPLTFSSIALIYPTPRPLYSHRLRRVRASQPHARLPEIRRPQSVACKLWGRMDANGIVLACIFRTRLGNERDRLICTLFN